MTIGETIWKDWGEVIAISVLLVGFVLAISMNNPWFVYIVIFLAGLMAGRVFFKKLGKQPIFHIFLITIGFLLGYLLGTFSAGANKKVVVLLFAIGWFVSHMAHKKGYIKN